MFPYEWCRSHFLLPRTLFTSPNRESWNTTRAISMPSGAPVSHAPSFGCNDPTSAGRKKTQLDAEGAKDVG